MVLNVYVVVFVQCGDVVGVELQVVVQGQEVVCVFIFEVIVGDLGVLVQQLVYCCVVVGQYVVVVVYDFQFYQWYWMVLFGLQCVVFVVVWVYIEWQGVGGVEGMGFGYVLGVQQVQVMLFFEGVNQ